MDPTMPRPDPVLDRLEKLLASQLSWPAEYTFKFIIPRASAPHLFAILDGLPFSERGSRTGRFLGVTVTARMESSEAVVALYRRAARVKGILAL